MKKDIEILDDLIRKERDWVDARIQKYLLDRLLKKMAKAAYEDSYDYEQYESQLFVYFEKSNIRGPRFTIEKFGFESQSFYLSGSSEDRRDMVLRIISEKREA